MAMMRVIFILIFSTSQYKHNNRIFSGAFYKIYVSIYFMKSSQNAKYNPVQNIVGNRS